MTDSIIIEGERYDVEPFRRPDNGRTAYYVQREGGGLYVVELNPMRCECGDHEFRNDTMRFPGPRVCRHIRAVQAFKRQEKPC